MILAQFNIGRIRYPLDDPRMKEFVDNVDRVNALANRLPGFIWRLQDKSGTALNIKVMDDPTIVPNLTLWDDEASLANFVFNTVHRQFIRKAHLWFGPIDGPKNVLWHVDAEHRPAMEEGVERLAHLKVHGNTDHAFSFSPRSIVGDAGAL